MNVSRPIFLPLLLLVALSLPPLAAGETEAQAQPEAVGQETEVHDTDLSEEPDSAEAEQERYRLLPIPILITEPAIGEGLGVALTLFHPVKKGSVEKPPLATPDWLIDASRPREAPPVVTAVAAAYTNNDTWMAGAFHSNHWRNDSIRYTGGLAVAQVNSEIYLLNAPLRFSMETTFTYQEVKFRLGRSPLMLGLGLTWMDADNRFRLNGGDLPGDPGFGLSFRNVGVETKLVWETRDNTMNPMSGQLAELALWRYDEALGGDFDYWSWRARLLSFHPLSKRLTLGLRLDTSGIDGTPPFFAYPFVRLRGVPSLRYQDRGAGAVEAELRYRLAPKWEFSAFAGYGFTGGNIPLFDNPGSIYNFGAGGRYKVFDAHNVWMGIDVARGPEDWNGYVQVGHPW